MENQQIDDVQNSQLLSKKQNQEQNSQLKQIGQKPTKSIFLNLNLKIFSNILVFSIVIIALLSYDFYVSFYHHQKKNKSLSNLQSSNEENILNQKDIKKQIHFKHLTTIQQLIKRSNDLQKITNQMMVEDDAKVTAVFINTQKEYLQNLNKTLTSFYKYNKYPLQDIIVILSNQQHSDQLEELLIRFPQVKWIIQGKKMTKLEIIDEAFKLVITPYVFYSDDTFEYLKEGFIQQSIKFYKKNQNLAAFQIIKANLKIDQNTGLQPSQFYQFNFNPGLRKMSDYKKIEKGFFKFTTQKQQQKVYQKLTNFFKANKAIRGQSQIQYAKTIIH